LLQVPSPLLSNTSTLPSEDAAVSDELTIDLLVAPILGSCLAYAAIAIAFKVSTATQPPTEVEEVIPQKVFCFQSIYLPAIELAPPRTSDLPHFNRADLWQTVMEGRENDREDKDLGFHAYLPPGADLELFSPVAIPPLNLGAQTKRSLFLS
jgi:hypothetical protein